MRGTLPGPHDVHVRYVGGPRDGHEATRRREAGEAMPTVVEERYDLHGVGKDLVGHAVFEYHWRVPHTGRTNPCSARHGGRDVCPGQRCPSGRRAEPAL